MSPAIPATTTSPGWTGGNSALSSHRASTGCRAADLAVGDTRFGQAIGSERDSAWIDVIDDLRWLPGGNRFLWVSERDGWRHAYSIARDGSDVRLLTPGQFDLAEPDSPTIGAPYIQAVDEAGGWVYFTASPANATQLYLYRARLDGKGQPERVTPAAASGFHRYRISPDAHWAFHTYSTFGTPPTTELIRPPRAALVVRTLEDNSALKARVAALRHQPVEFFKAPAAEGVSLDGWLMRPVDFDSTRRYPVLFYVYGGPWSQTVLDAWGGPRYLWHLMLTQRGYIVASLDARGTSAPKGRAWRKVIYGHVGVVESAPIRRLGCPRGAATPLHGRDSGRRVGLEQRRLHDSEPAFQVARALRHRHGGVAGDRLASLRQHLH